MRSPGCRLAIAAALALVAGFSPPPIAAQEAGAGVTAERVTRAIERARKFLVSRQHNDGSWSAGVGHYGVGVTSLALLALVNSGMTAEDPPVQKCLEYLRSIEEPTKTYEVALMIMALTDAKDGLRDQARVLSLAQRLENMQIVEGVDEGSWTYMHPSDLVGRAGGDRSNAQYAVLGLYAAARAGVPIDRRTWERVRHHWSTQQSFDGGWGYTGVNPGYSTGSMTVAGLATLTIVDMMLRDDSDVRPDGTIDCCAEAATNEDLQQALDWMARRFDAASNPSTTRRVSSDRWYLYYMYGLERAGRFTGKRFFGRHDWYRRGAEELLAVQSIQGAWRGEGGMENDPVVGTSLALLFLSKGLAPVLVNKLAHGPFVRGAGDLPEIVGDDWNKHPHDVRQLTDHITGLEKWPKLVTWQVVELPKLLNVELADAAQILRQAPVLYVSGQDEPAGLLERPEYAQILREYINQGGFIFAVGSCDNHAGFEDGMQDLVKAMYPGENRKLEPLKPEHDIYRAEYPLDPAKVKLWGVDFGCRTAIVYSPDDIACYWERWSPQEPPNRRPKLKQDVKQAMEVGVNVIAYATGREPLNKLESDRRINLEGQITRGFLEIAKVVHGGGWNTAPDALKNLLIALNRTVGMAATTEERKVALGDEAIFRYPILYMHGRTRFQIDKAERDRLRQYLDRGGVLFADACCGSRHFDESFRDLVRQLYPETKLERIPAEHEMFRLDPGFDVRQVERRTPEAAADPQAPLEQRVHRGPPFLEGVEDGGRYTIVYSKYDISCALERQASAACAGYVHDDAVRIAVNVILYAMLQNP
ncbi:MAG: DUF4159 domain-containing protein [Planctomycetes bacterium]|nr:DUF4159 domain-containing protein [Planctomycetota bacterium]